MVACLWIQCGDVLVDTVHAVSAIRLCCEELPVCFPLTVAKCNVFLPRRSRKARVARQRTAELVSGCAQHADVGQHRQHSAVGGCRHHGADEEAAGAVGHRTADVPTAPQQPAEADEAVEG